MLRELRIARYKNLERIVVPVASRTALYGQNGTGKTNVLEALALLAGDQVTLSQVARRAVTPRAGDVQAVFLGSPSLMCTGRDPADRMFWEIVGLTAVPRNWNEGIANSELPVGLRSAIADPGRCAVRYSLRSVEGLEALGDYDRGAAYRGDTVEWPKVTRTYDRTLCVPSDIAIALRHETDLPDIARPLAQDGSADQLLGEWADALVLPPTDSIPIRVVWLGRERTDDEVWHDWATSIDEASNAVRTLTHFLRSELDLLDWPEEIGDDSTWLARKWFAEHAHARIAKLLPQLRISPDNNWLDIEVINPTPLRDGPAYQRPEHTLQAEQRSWISQLSAGERGLVDEALLEASSALLQDAISCTTTVAIVLTATDEEKLALQAELEPTLQVLRESYWTDSDVRAVLRWGHKQAQRRWGNSSLKTSSVVRVFDEPERHLHPGAQTKLAAGLQANLDADTIIIASHSAEFLAWDGWSSLHAMRTPEGVVIDSFDPTDSQRLNAVARNLGLRGGDLLNRYRYVLLVEGPHDEAFLAGYCSELLNSHRILVEPMFGADEVLQAADAHMLIRQLDVGVGVILDHAKTKSGTQRNSKEGQLLSNLRRSARQRGMSVDTYSLTRPDIIAYIADDVIRARAPRFPGFRTVERDWKHRPGSSFKTLASQHTSGLVFDRDTIREMAAQTARLQLRPPDDLAELLSTLTENARRGAHLSDLAARNRSK